MFNGSWVPLPALQWLRDEGSLVLTRKEIVLGLERLRELL
jgi:hypothetical protein